MIRGITPVDAAFELMGLHQAQVLMRFIFVETFAGKAIFAVGFILSLKSGFQKGDFKQVFVFLMVFFSLCLLLVVPRAVAIDPVSAMEQGGYRQNTASQILKKNGCARVMLNPVLDTASRTIDSFITAAVAVFDGGGVGLGYLASPFLFIKVSLLTSGIIDRGIVDPQLEEKTINFYQDHFWPAVKSLGRVDRSIWPGDADVLAAYKDEGRAQWQSLREALYQACDQEKIFAKMFERFYDGRVDQDAVVRSLLSSEIRHKPRQYALMSYASAVAGMAGRSTEHEGVRDIPWLIMVALPFMQGGALFWLWSAWPVFLSLALLLRQVALPVMFAGVLFSVKAWTLIWVVLDKMSIVWFGIDQARGGFAMWESSSFIMFIVISALVLPLVMTAGVIVLSGRTTRPLKG